MAQSQVVAKETDNAVLEPPRLSLRWILAILGSFMHFIGCMLRNSLSVAIVAMVNTTKSLEEEYDYNYTFSCPNAYNTSTEETSYSDQAEFDWDSSTQGIILGGFLWGYFIGRVSGGRIAEVLGQRETASLSMIIGGVLELLSPVAATLSPYCLLTARFLMGLALGPMYPALHSLLSKWALRSQLGSMITCIYAGAPLGGMFGMLTAGAIIDNLGWRWVFYIQGTIPFIWVPLWWFYIRNDPATHPLITRYEADLLGENSHVTRRKTVPWKEILMCPYIYVCTFGQFTRSWMDVIQSTGGPSFFNKQIGIDLTQASYVCATTSLLALPTMIFYGQTSDYIIKNNYVSKLTGRRIFHAIGTCGPGLIYLGIILSGCNALQVVIFWLFMGMFMSASAVSGNISIIDFAPNYTGTVMGLMGIGNGFASFGPLVISALVKQENGWDKVFYIEMGLLFASFLLYTFVMSDKPQSWNYDQDLTVEVSKNSSSKEGMINFSFTSEEKDKKISIVKQ